MESPFFSERRNRNNVSRQLLICTKCGSDKIEREEYNIMCNDCGSISFFGV